VRRLKKYLIDTITQLEEVFEQRDSSQEDVDKWYEAQQQLSEIYQSVEIYWSTRAKELWLKEGDRNIAFFHKAAISRQKKNHIGQMELQSQLFSDPVEIKKTCSGFLSIAF
jgi:hypothetical protein